MGEHGEGKAFVKARHVPDLNGDKKAKSNVAASVCAILYMATVLFVWAWVSISTKTVAGLPSSFLYAGGFLVLLASGVDMIQVWNLWRGRK